MADDLDRALARLAVEQGLLGRDEAAQYWQQIQAPGSPRFVQVLLQSGRLKPPDVERLRALWQQQQGGQPAQPPQQQRPNTASQPRVAAPAQAYGRPSAPAPQAAPPAASTPVDALGDDGAGSWDEALQRDQQLARILLSRSLTTQDRLRECRQLQLQHRMRLAPVLVKKNYVERAAVEDALAAVRAALPAGAGTGRMRLSGAAPALPPPSTPAPQDNPFSMPAGAIDQDNMPTLNVGPGGFNRPPTPQDSIPTIMGAPGNVSLDEMNPFGQAGPPGGGGAPRAAPRGLPNPVLSGDELDAFTDIPLQPLNQSARIVRGSVAMPGVSPPPAAAGNGPGGTGWGPGPGVLPDTNAEASNAPAPQDAPPVVEDPSERPAAPKKKTTARQAEPPKKGGKGLLIAIVLFVLLLLAAAAAAAVYVFVIKK